MFVHTVNKESQTSFMVKLCIVMIVYILVKEKSRHLIQLFKIYKSEYRAMFSGTQHRKVRALFRVPFDQSS